MLKIFKKNICKCEVQQCVGNVENYSSVKLDKKNEESNLCNHILFEITDGRFINENKYNAASKPRNDTIITAIRLGFKPFIFNSRILGKSKIRYFRTILFWLNQILLLVSICFKCRKIKDSVIFIQYPFVVFDYRFAKKILSKLKSRRCEFIVLLHDIETIRQKRVKPMEMDKIILELADVIIVHTHQMAEEISCFDIDLCSNIRFVKLAFFDYLSNIEMIDKDSTANINLIYAGNLDKSLFLRKLQDIGFNNEFKMFLYGAYSDNIPNIEGVEYKGKFVADRFDSIEGNWGLVWDGESVDSCTGQYGEYLKINSPFKFSLYLAANRPVVVWSKSALASYVKEYKLGICVDSLKDIEKTIKLLTVDELTNIQSSVYEYSKKVKNGEMLEAAIFSSLKIMSEKNEIRCGNCLS